MFLINRSRMKVMVENENFCRSEKIGEKNDDHIFFAPISIFRARSRAVLFQFEFRGTKNQRYGKEPIYIFYSPYKFFFSIRIEYDYIGLPFKGVVRNDVTQILTSSSSTSQFLQGVTSFVYDKFLLTYVKNRK